MWVGCDTTADSNRTSDAWPAPDSDFGSRFCLHFAVVMRIKESGATLVPLGARGYARTFRE